MRQALQQHRWATLLVVGLLLFTTSGLMLSRMTCLMSGRSVVAFGMLEDCCPPPVQHEGAALAPVCCVFGNAAADVQPFMPTTVMDQFVVQAWPLEPMVDVIMLQEEAHEPSALRDRAPPLPGSTRLALFATYRI